MNVIRRSVVASTAVVAAGALVVAGGLALASDRPGTAENPPTTYAQDTREAPGILADPTADNTDVFG
ncbi:hypothetical protein Bcav_1112 [Beutenbergia cavernae DSM 12333]|uniref:Uncharacterized protein n=1 Tax=Beutenbergia cavernae (strain ATCC BAA-8 / DSM 12333 / CCUG 43141 / JCM 11478 / NBRC 16432 / NCIMB 13614 / HKI 0122) TaxID=471853 RepID=C5C0W8_BEUC1|nr:hypothetical protein [Beutenbergia cavernae]ACQ79372.1 hypothetical protein Bcav_1112 [Beutenbergia cavernae DSM 12333]